MKSGISAGSCAGTGEGCAGPEARRGCRHRLPGGDHRLVAVPAQYLLVEALKVNAGVHPQLIGDGGPGLLVDLQRLGLAPGAIQRAHEQGPQPFPERVVGKQPAHLGHHLGVPAARQARLGAQLQRLDP